MSERKVNDMLSWIEKVKTNGSTALPTSISSTQDMIIEIEETIEVIQVRRPHVEGASSASYNVIEKYDASRKFTIDGDDDETARLKARLAELESKTKLMEDNYKDLLATYMRLQQHLKNHVSKLTSDSDISGKPFQLSTRLCNYLLFSDHGGDGKDAKVVE